MILNNLEGRQGILQVAVGVKEASAVNADAFRNELMKLLNTAQEQYIVLNMEQVSYIDSTFLGSMVSCLKHAIGLGKDILLVSLQKDVSDLLLLIRMDKVFKISGSFAAAVQQISL